VSSNPVKSQRNTGSGLASKSERRAAYRQAGMEQAAAAKKRRIFGYVLTGVLVLGVATGISAWMGAFTPEPPSTAAQLAVRPVLTKGEGDLTELKVTTLVQGYGEPVKKGDTVLIQYAGIFYKTGEEFDSSWSRGGQAIPLQIQDGAVIPGFVQGLIGVKTGSRVQLDIPSNLAYGDSPQQGQPAGPLRFVVDVMPPATSAAS
jgi:peptidylprolyl isomerase